MDQPGGGGLSNGFSLSQQEPHSSEEANGGERNAIQIDAFAKKKRGASCFHRYLVRESAWMFCVCAIGMDSNGLRAIIWFFLFYKRKARVGDNGYTVVLA